MSDKTKKTRLTIPVVDLDKMFGPRRTEMGESLTETKKSNLEKRQEALDKLEMEEDILDVEDRIRRRRDGRVAPEAPKDSFGEQMMNQVVIPLVNRALEEKGGRDSDDTVNRALRIAEKAVSRTPAKAAPGGGGAVDELEKGIEVFTKIKTLVEGEKAEKNGAGEGTKKEDDVLAELDRGLDLVKKIREVFPSEGGGGGMSDAMMEFKKWEKNFELKTKTAERTERLERRRIDKAHDAKLIELGIQKEKNDLFRDGFKRIGRAIALGLGEEDEYDEEEETAPAKGRGQLITEECSECGAKVLIPPEAQVAGKEIKCSKCNSIFVWE